MDAERRAWFPVDVKQNPPEEIETVRDSAEDARFSALCALPLTGRPCYCRRGQARDNCPRCEGTGMQIDFAAIRAAR